MLLPAYAFPLAFAILSKLSFATSSNLNLPSELFSPLIAQKLLATGTNLTTSTSGIPTVYPQYTTRDTGKWVYFAADGWTSGFLPATFYALHERAGLCQSQNAGDDGNGTEWLELGRTWATGEVPSETKTGVGHDVGFLSFPFVEELKV